MPPLVTPLNISDLFSVYAYSLYKRKLVDHFRRNMALMNVLHPPSMVFVICIKLKWHMNAHCTNSHLPRYQRHML